MSHCCRRYSSTVMSRFAGSDGLAAVAIGLSNWCKAREIQIFLALARLCLTSHWHSGVSDINTYAHCWYVSRSSGIFIFPRSITIHHPAKVDQLRPVRYSPCCSCVPSREKDFRGKFPKISNGHPKTHTDAPSDARTVPLLQT
jgi:hypothetical protein